MADIFLSYASEDRERVRPLVERLEEHGWDVWWDREIPPGMTWPDVIRQALAETRAMVVVWTEASVNSKWVQIETTKGEKGGALVPVSLDRIEPPLQFSLIQSADLVGWDGSPMHPQFRAAIEQLEMTLGVPERGLAVEAKRRRDEEDAAEALRNHEEEDEEGRAQHGGGEGKKRVLPFIAVVIVLAAGWAAWTSLRPPTQVGATVTCGDPQMFESDLGIMNIAQLALGQYLYVDTARSVAFHGGFLNIEDSIFSEPMAHLSLQYSAALSVSVSGDVPAEVQTRVQEAISRETRLTAGGLQRVTIPSVLQALEDDPRAPQEIPSMLANAFGDSTRGEIILFVIHAIVTADSVAVGFAGSAEGPMQPRLAIGDFEVSIRYDCSQILQASGSRMPVFFKVIPIGYREGSGFFLDTGVDVDFTKLDVAVMAR